MAELKDWQGKPLIDFSRQKTPPAPEITAPETTPWTTPPKEPPLPQGTIIPPANPVPPRVWPQAKGKPGQIVKLDGATVGKCDDEGIVHIFGETEPSSRARALIRGEAVSKVDSKGELK